MSRTYYTEDHEWIRVDNGVATVGITNYAQEQLGDLVFVDLPSPGASASKGDSLVVVESVKAASDVFSPIDGEVKSVNEALASEPGLVNSSPEGDGWLWTMSIADESQLDELMDADAYQKTIA
ncbi:MAG: glycine cleavage system protein GcvH [Oricola sp.]